MEIVLTKHYSKTSMAMDHGRFEHFVFFHRKSSIVMLDCQRVALKMLRPKICQRAWRIKKGIQQEYKRVALEFHKMFTLQTATSCNSSFVHHNMVPFLSINWTEDDIRTTIDPLKISPR